MGAAQSASLSQCAMSAMRAKPISTPAVQPATAQARRRRGCTSMSEAKKNPQDTWPLTKEQLLLHWSVITPARVKWLGPPKFSTS
jgi:hypothetical protein